MKAKLLLIITEEEFKECDERTILHLYLIVAGKSYDLLYYPTEVDSSNKDDYLNKIEEAINESTLFINSIPGIKLCVDGSIYSFIDENEEEIRKFINQLVIEI